MLTTLAVGQRVAYASQRYGPKGRRITHYYPGTVSSWNGEWVFVKFDANVAQHGWEGTTAKACCRLDLWDMDETPAAHAGALDG